MINPLSKEQVIKPVKIIKPFYYKTNKEDQWGIKSDDYKLLVDAESNELISIMTNKQVVYSNEDLWNYTGGVLQSAGINFFIDGRATQIDRQRVYLVFVFKDIFVGTPDDKIHLCLIATNSYTSGITTDITLAFRFGLYRANNQSAMTSGYLPLAATYFRTDFIKPFVKTQRQNRHIKKKEHEIPLQYSYIRQVIEQAIMVFPYIQPKIDALRIVAPSDELKLAIESKKGFLLFINNFPVYMRKRKITWDSMVTAYDLYCELSNWVTDVSVSNYRRVKFDLMTRLNKIFEI